MSASNTITQDDLHAYVDGYLAPNDVERVEAWLAENPEDAASIHAYQLQNSKIGQTFNQMLDEDIPNEMLEIVTAKKEKPATNSIPWLRLAASIVLLLVGGMSGWMLNEKTGSNAQGDQVAFVDQAVGAHHVFVSEVRHPVEVPASQEAHLVKWLSKRVGTQLSVPDLQDGGFQLVGGRLLADASLPAAQFMYEDNTGRRLTLYVRSSDEEVDTSFRFVKDDGATAFYWIDNKFAYAMVAPMDRSTLLPIANKVYQILSGQ